jgi:DNA-binding MarR family transcriptional regulator
VINYALQSNATAIVSCQRGALEGGDSPRQLPGLEPLLLRVGWLEQRRFAQDLAGFGLTLPQFFVLRSIARRGEGSTMSMLAQDTMQHCATMTGIVFRLARMQLITRRRGKHDRRQVLIELTPEGRSLLERVRHSREARLRATLRQLSPPDAAELLRLLHKYLEAFGDQLESSERTGQGAHGDSARPAVS